MLRNEQGDEAGGRDSPLALQTQSRRRSGSRSARWMLSSLRAASRPRLCSDSSLIRNVPSAARVTNALSPPTLRSRHTDTLALRAASPSSDVLHCGLIRCMPAVVHVISHLNPIHPALKVNGAGKPPAVASCYTPLVLQLGSLCKLLPLGRRVPPGRVVRVPPTMGCAVPGRGGGPHSQPPAFLVLLQVVLQGSKLVLQDLHAHSMSEWESVCMPCQLCSVHPLSDAGACDA